MRGHNKGVPAPKKPTLGVRTALGTATARTKAQHGEEPTGLRRKPTRSAMPEPPRSETATPTPPRLMKEQARTSELRTHALEAASKLEALATEVSAAKARLGKASAALEEAVRSVERAHEDRDALVTTALPEAERDHRRAQTSLATAEETERPGAIRAAAYAVADFLTAAWTGKRAERPESRALRDAREKAAQAAEHLTNMRNAAGEAEAALDAAKTVRNGASEAHASVEADVRRFENEHAEANARAEQLSMEANRSEQGLEAEKRAYDEASRRDQGLDVRPKGRERAARAWRLHTAIVSKPGTIPQDAIATNAEAGRFAIADGVTNSSFSGEFARALVKHFVENPPKKGQSMDAWLRPAQAEWTRETKDAVAAAKSGGPWYMQQREHVGHTTLVGVELGKPTGKSKERVMRGTTLGDSVLFHVREGKVVRSWPVTRSEDFEGPVYALPSAGDIPNHGDPGWKVQRMTTRVKPGDEVFLMTDAVGKWTMKELEAGRDPFSRLRHIRSNTRLQAFVNGHRQGRNGNPMDVDDVALLRVVVPE